MVTTRNITTNTLRGYMTILNNYTTYHEKQLSPLIQEAQKQEEEHIPPNKTKLKDRLLKFRTHMIQQEYSKNTINMAMSKLHTFYTHHEITVPQLPQVKLKDEYVTNYQDIPSRQDIQTVIEKVPQDFKALILFMSSSGTAKAETLNLTIQDFIEATKEYHTNASITKILLELSQQENIVPTWYIKRKKTNKFYYTFSSPESSTALINYLRERNNRNTLQPDEKIFLFTSCNVTKKFETINDDMGWGFKGKYRYFRSHALRKYHASNIQLPVEYIDELQGRAKNKIHQAYIKTNPEQLKQVYIEHMHNVMIYNTTPSQEDTENQLEITVETPQEKPQHTENTFELGVTIGKLEARIEALEKIIYGGNQHARR